MSEALLDRSIGGAEGVLGVDGVGVTDGVRALPEPAPDRLEGGRHPHTDRAAAERRLPRGDLSARQRWFRNLVARAIGKVCMYTLFRVEVANPERFLQEPALYYFNHLSWMDTTLVLAAFPAKPRLYMYGPKEADMGKGVRNRFMWWTGVVVPFSPHKDNLLTSVKWAQAVFDSGGVLGIAAEGGIHVHEGDLMPFQEGAAYLALRAGVPLVPVAITGTSWARFRGRILLRVGEPIPTGERPTREVVAKYTARAWHALKAMVKDDQDSPPPSFIERWFTDWFNDWGEGGRKVASLRYGPNPADVPYGPNATDASA